jgi:hypothetical protein
MMAESGWNAGQFLQTLAFFRTIPFLGRVDWLFPTSQSPLALPKPAVGVLAITPQIEQHLQSRLMALGQEVIYQPQGWTDCSRLFVEAAALEQALPDLEKWASQDVNRLLIDFQRPTQALQCLWGSLDDVVMGGVSQSGWSWLPDGALFSGRVSTANSGGFASVRSRNLNPPLDLSGYGGLRLLVKGDHQRYKFILRNSEGWDSLAYMTSFTTQVGEWQSVELSFSDLVATFRARSVPTAPAFQPSQVRSLQFMLSKFEFDRALNPAFIEGPFQFKIASLSGWTSKSQKQLFLFGESTSAIPALPVQIQTWTLDSSLPLIS